MHNFLGNIIPSTLFVAKWTRQKKNSLRNNWWGIKAPPPIDSSVFFRRAKADLAWINVLFFGMDIKRRNRNYLQMEIIVFMSRHAVILEILPKKIKWKLNARNIDKYIKWRLFVFIVYLWSFVIIVTSKL